MTNPSDPSRWEDKKIHNVYLASRSGYAGSFDTEEGQYHAGRAVRVVGGPHDEREGWVLRPNGDGTHDVRLAPRGLRVAAAKLVFIDADLESFDEVAALGQDGDSEAAYATGILRVVPGRWYVAGRDGVLAESTEGFQSVSLEGIRPVEVVPGRLPLEETGSVVLADVDRRARERIAGARWHVAGEPYDLALRLARSLEATRDALEAERRLREVYQARAELLEREAARR